MENDYFSRAQYPGRQTLRSLDERPPNDMIPDHTLNPRDGVVTLNLGLPVGASEGESFRYQLVVQDDTLVDPFVNSFVVTVGPYQKERDGGDSPPTPPAAQQGLAIPTPILVYESDWKAYGFDRDSALKAVYDEPDEEEAHYTYYVNMDNVYLNTELKATRENPEIVKSRWQFGMVLIGMALLRDRADSAASDEDSNSAIPEEEVFKTTAAIAPVLLPLIEHLGTLSDEELST